MGKKNREKSERRSLSSTLLSDGETSSNPPSSSFYPPEFPVGYKTPKNEFLRNEGKYKKSFQKSLETCYEGFVVDYPEEINDKEKEPINHYNHKLLQKAFVVLENTGIFFRTDITQPFGLGTKCANTYVTRCLLGEDGTTYKYLGLRMFAHPWNIFENEERSKDDREMSESESMSVEKAIQIIYELNQQLTQRTKNHLNNLNQNRRKTRGQTTSMMVKGRAGFDVTLINRMQDTPELKREPTMSDKVRYSVSWHADSSLENYSTIAVYHTILSPSKHSELLSNNNNDKHEDEFTESSDEDELLSSRWSIGLRVAHDSEGPHTGGVTNNDRKNNSKEELRVESNNPPSIAVSLPSGSAYFLLDDFNHHHQHAVLVNNDDNNNDGDTDNNIGNNNKTKTAGVRYASTHRLLREGHNVNFILERCKNTCAKFHKKGVKIWRSEQLLLNEIESEWIRQFYVQGLALRKYLWKYWEDYIHQLLRYWTLLENRTKQVLDLLRYAAEERCDLSNNDNCNKQRAERKVKQRRKKALASVEEILERSRNNNAKKNNEDVVKLCYDPIIELLEERATMRLLWNKRENDHLYKIMPKDSDYRPLDVPFQFQGRISLSNQSQQVTTVKEKAISPLDGTTEGLQQIIHDMKCFAKAFVSGQKSDLPKVSFSMITSSVKETITPITKGEKEDNTQCDHQQQQQQQERDIHNNGKKKKKGKKRKNGNTTGNHSDGANTKKKKKRRY